MKRLKMMMALVLMLGLCACKQGAKQSDNDTTSAPSATTNGSASAKATEEEPALEFPPLAGFVVRGLPLFVPFNEGDIPEEGKSLKQKPEQYALFLMGEKAFDVTFCKEKNKELKEDESCINEYLYQTATKMKGMEYLYADATQVTKYMDTHGDILPEGDIMPMTTADGVLVTRDYMKSRTLLKATDTTTEDPDGPTFPEAVIKKVEKLIGTAVEKNRVSTVFVKNGKEEYEFGVMTTAKKDNTALGIYVLSKGTEVSIKVDTLRADGEGDDIDWSMADPEQYPEPNISVVAQSNDGLDIFCSMPDEEATEFLWLRQDGNRLIPRRMGGFSQRYE